MELREAILQKTDGGKDVLLFLYPGTEEYFGSRKCFRVRPEDDTPSASYKWREDRWLFNDFGDGQANRGKAMDCFAAWMERNDCTFSEAMKQIAAQWNVADERGKTPSLYGWEEETAPTDAREGEWLFRLRAFTDAEVKLFCPNATESLLKQLGWECIDRCGWVKGGKVGWKVSTPSYPMFRRRCETDGAPFYKVYFAKDPDKSKRFRHWPNDGKRAKYIHGLAEVQRLYAERNAEKEAELHNQPGKEDAPFKEEKLPEVVICSGERDAVCAWAMGYPAVWFNSECEDVEGEQMAVLRKYAKTIYNIPDLDTTGVAEGRKKALAFRSVRTVWLPDSLREQRDWRGKAKKDLRDWFGDKGRKKQEFDNLLEGAVCTDFLYEVWNEKKKMYTYTVMPTRLLEFLRLMGYHTLHDETAMDARFVHIDGHIVKEVWPRDVSSFVMGWARRKNLTEQERDALINSPCMTPAKLSNLQEIDPDFTAHGYGWQLFYGKDKCYKVTGAGISMAEDQESFVWENKVAEATADVGKEFFTVARKEDGTWGIKINDLSSPFFCYLINTARVHWRKEMEQRFGEDEEARKAYAATHRFCIDGESLTEEEVAEQMQNLVNKLFVVGYLCHRHKESSRAWAVIAMDNTVRPDGGSNGGTGKTVFFSVLKNFLKVVQFDGKQKDVVSDPHQYEEVDRHTDLIFVDDCHQFFRVEKYFSLITGGIPINVKHKKRYTLEFSESPKIAFSTNYPQMDLDDSTLRRLVYLTFSDYYHTRSPKNDYRETRRVHDDFGYDLYGEKYGQELRDADFSFIMQCTRFYLNVMQTMSVPIQPNLGNVEKRRVLAVLGYVFMTWANEYFAPEGGHLDTQLVRAEVYNSYLSELSDKKREKISPQQFLENLRMYAEYTPWISCLNPKAMCGKDGRMIKTVGGVTQECLYMRSMKAATSGEAVKEAVQETLPF